MTKACGSFYDAVASTPEGARALASGRLHRDALAILHEALAKSNFDFDDLAGIFGISKVDVQDVFDGNRYISLNTLATFLAAMGYEVTLTPQPLGTARSQAHEKEG